jgi:hypothetical protein
MGSFGYGLGDNDDALDSIGTMSFLKDDGTFPTLEEAPYLEGDYDQYRDEAIHNFAEANADPKAYLESFDTYDNDRGILGLAEWMMDHGVDVTPARELLERCLKAELEDEVLGCWTSPLDRYRALKVFRDRLDGKPYEEDSEELLSKMEKAMRG